MEKAVAEGNVRLAVLGDGELAEIAFFVSEEGTAEIVGFVAKNSSRERIAGQPVVADWQQTNGADAALLATVDDAKAVFEAFTTACPNVPVYVPSQLNALVRDK
jgi:hypothetical protein